MGTRLAISNASGQLAQCSASMSKKGLLPVQAVPSMACQLACTLPPEVSSLQLVPWRWLRAPTQHGVHGFCQGREENLGSMPEYSNVRSYGFPEYSRSKFERLCGAAGLI